MWAIIAIRQPRVCDEARLWQIIASSATWISISPNCQCLALALAGCPNACAVVSSITNGPVETEKCGGNHAERASAWRCGIDIRCLIRSARRASRSRAASCSVYHRDSPPSASIHEERDHSINVPFMPVFNNLVMFDQPMPQNSLDTIVPDLPKAGPGARTARAHLQAAPRRQMARRQAVHRGRRQMHLRPADRQGAAEASATTRAKPGTTMSTTSPSTATPRRPSISNGRSPRCWRCSPRATRRSIPAMSARRDAHQADRHRPVQVRRVQGATNVKLARNPDYWKPGLPYLDGIEYTIIPNRSTAILGFVAGEFDMTFPRGHDPADERHQGAVAEGDLRGRADQRTTNIIVNRTRRRSTIPTCAGRWRWRSTARPSSRSSSGPGRNRRHDAAAAGRPVGPADGDLELPGYGPDVEKNREEARKIMEKRATAPTSGSRSRSRPATSRSTAIPP